MVGIGARRQALRDVDDEARGRLARASAGRGRGRPGWPPRGRAPRACGGVVAASPSASASSECDSRTRRSASSQQRVVGRPVGRDDAVAQRLEVALQVGQRGPQLVGGVGDEVAPHRLLALEAGRHLVERIGEAGELLRAVARDAGGVVARRRSAARRCRPRRSGGRASGPGRSPGRRSRRRRR